MVPAIECQVATLAVRPGVLLIEIDGSLDPAFAIANVAVNLGCVHLHVEGVLAAVARAEDPGEGSMESSGGLPFFKGSIRDEQTKRPPRFTATPNPQVTDHQTIPTAGLEPAHPFG